MAIDPLQYNVPIVDAQGRPTPQFARQWAQILETLQALQQNTTVVAGSYGGVGQDMAITVDAIGRITSIADVP